MQSEGAAHTDHLQAVVYIHGDYISTSCTLNKIVMTWGCEGDIVITKDTGTYSYLYLSVPRIFLSNTKLQLNYRCIFYGSDVHLSFLHVHLSLCSFSQAKKCSNEGRALMQLDFQQYRTQIEKISHIRLVLRTRSICSGLWNVYIG